MLQVETDGSGVGLATQIGVGTIDASVIHDPLFAQAEHHLKVREIATTKDIVNGGSVYVAIPDFGAKYPKVLAAVDDKVAKLTEWAAKNREKFAEATSTATGIELDVARTAIGRSDLIVGPVTPAIIAKLQETADAFLKVGAISKPIVIRNAVWTTFRMSPCAVVVYRDGTVAGAAIKAGGGPGVGGVSPLAKAPTGLPKTIGPALPWERSLRRRPNSTSVEERA